MWPNRRRNINPKLYIILLFVCLFFGKRDKEWTCRIRWNQEVTVVKSVLGVRERIGMCQMPLHLERQAGKRGNLLELSPSPGPRGAEQLQNMDHNKKGNVLLPNSILSARGLRQTARKCKHAAKTSLFTFFVHSFLLAPVLWGAAFCVGATFKLLLQLLIQFPKNRIKRHTKQSEGLNTPRGLSLRATNLSSGCLCYRINRE